MLNTVNVFSLNHIDTTSVYILWIFIYAVPGVKPRASYMISKLSATELHPQRSEPQC